MKTILVPVDLSAATTRVGDAACQLAKFMNARLVLLHVLLPPPVMLADYYAFDSGVMAEAVGAGEKFAAHRLQALARLCSRQQLEVECQQVAGQAVPVILARAAALKADYIVLGSHGHGAVFDLLVGSTTQGVLRKAPCPVLVVPMAPAGRSRR
jgi:nucleotide-binding universal stress UspA family protein